MIRYDWNGTINHADDPEKIKSQIEDLHAEIRYISYQLECVTNSLKKLLPCED